MHTKLLSAAGCTAVLLAAGAAQAQVPIANVWHSGETGYYVAVALQNSGGPHVVFMDYGKDYEWDPFSSNVWPISGSYGKRYDAVAYWAVMDGNGAWDFDNQAWYTLTTPGAWQMDDHPTAYKEMAVFSEQLWGGSEPGLTLRHMPGTSINHYLDNNGRHERRPNLYEYTVAYEYDAGGTYVAVHDLINDVEHFHNQGRRPDVVGSLVAYEDGGGSIRYEDWVYGTSGQIVAPGGCSYVFRPLIGGWGQWIIYGAECGGSFELFLHEIATGYEQHIDGLNSAEDEYFHTVGEWLVYSDANKEVVLIEFGSAPPVCDTPNMPAYGIWNSGLIGRDPATVQDGVGKWHTLFATGSNTIDWVPGNAPGAVGPPMSGYDGVYYNAAAVYMGNVWSYDVDVGAWTWIAAGGTNPTMYKDFLAWTNPSNPSDRAIGWGVGSIGSFTTGVSFAGNLRHEQRPAVFEHRAAIEQFNGTWDVRVVDVQSTSTLAFFGGAGNQTQPDLWEHSVVYLDDLQGLRWVEDYAWSSPVSVPTPSACCSTVRNPRLGYWGKWVIFEATGCSHGRNELRLVNMGNGNEYLLDYIAAPVNGQPQYGISENQLAYVREDGRVIHVSLDDSQI